MSQAIILAAGESSRFWPLNNQHKSQIKILGKPLIYWALRGLSEKGIKDIILVVGPNSSLEKEVGSVAKDLNIFIRYIVQDKPLGTGDAIFRAKDLVKEQFFVFWPYKIIAGELVENMLKLVEKEKAQAVLLAAKTDTPWEYGILKMENNKISEIVENPEKGKEPSDLQLLGSCLLQPDFFEYYQKVKQHPENFIDALNLYVKAKATGLVILEKDAVSLKYPWDLSEILKIKFQEEGFRNYISPDASIGENVVINGIVYIEDEATIGDNTVISGPCFIGKNCKIGASNVFRGPVDLENDVTTGSFAEIKNSIIQEGTHLHSGYLGDSIIGRNCRFGAGFITANRRIDRKNIESIVKGKKTDTGLTYFGTVVGDNTRFGIHSGTMPGVLIGSDCTIGPGTLVFKNIEDNSSLFTQFNFKEGKNENSKEK